MTPPDLMNDTRFVKRVASMYARWQDEREYEDFDEYRKLLQQMVMQLSGNAGFSFCSATASPFGFVVSDGAGNNYRFWIAPHTITLQCQRINVTPPVAHLVVWFNPSNQEQPYTIDENTPHADGATTRFADAASLTAAIALWMKDKHHYWRDTPQWLREKGEEYRVPKWFEENCEDHSWHNDAMPIFHYKGYGIFVDSERPEDSEFCEGRKSGAYQRFGVSRIQGDGYNDRSSFSTDNLDELITWLLSMTAPANV